jgi:NitT/TauT family transport system substrate-binding protein
MNRKTNRIVAAVLLAMMAVLAACGSNTGNETAPSENNTNNNAASGNVEPIDVTLGMLRLTSSAPLFIALEKGYFEEEGLNVTEKWFEAAQPIAVATVSGDIDIGATGITASLYNMINAGQQLYIVADKGREQPGYRSTALMVHSESAVTSVSDLKGKKIGITQTGSTYHYMAGRLLEKYGLSLDDVELVPLSKISSMMDSLKGKQVDAILLNEPNITKVENDGYGKVIASIGDEFEYQTSAIFFSEKMAQNSEAAKRFMNAYVKATNYYYDAVLVKENGQLVPGENYDEVIDIIAKYTDEPKENVALGLPYMDRDGRLLEEDIQTQIDWYAANGLIEGTLDAASIINTEYLEEAIAAKE